MKEAMIVIKKSKIQGSGVFAAKYIKKDSAVYKFSDKTVLIKHKSGCDCRICRMSIQVGKFRWLYPGQKAVGSFQNHSCNPNCGIKGRSIIAIKNIKAGEEITIDYSTTTIDRAWKMKCCCGARTCRKAIHDISSLSPRTFKKFQLFMPAYVRNFYLKHCV